MSRNSENDVHDDNENENETDIADKGIEQEEHDRGESLGSPSTAAIDRTNAAPNTAPRPSHHPGYYQQMYSGPPPGSEGSHAHAYPPRGYEGQGPPPPYGYGYPPSPYMAPPPYGHMYGPPPYQHPMYGGPPPPYYNQYPPGPGGEHPHDPYAAHHHQYHHQQLHPQSQERKPPPPPRRAPPPLQQGETDSHMDDEDNGDEGEDGMDEGTGDEEVSARIKTYIKPNPSSTQDVLDRRSRKNQQSRARAAKLRLRILEIEAKPEEDRTEEEMHIWQQFEQRRQRKNNRSRERALEKKEEIDRILAKPDKKRTKIEKQFLETALAAKKRKNEGDRLRRQRLKDLGLSTKGLSGVRPGISARGPLPTQYQHLVGSGPHPHPAHHAQMYHNPYPPHPGYPPQYGVSGMDGEVPMSPMPPHHPQHPHAHHMGMPSSPPPYASGGFHHSPQRRAGGARSDRGGSVAAHGYAPPEAYHGHGLHSQGGGGRPSPTGDEGHRIHERNNPDGSTSISVQPGVKEDDSAPADEEQFEDAIQDEEGVASKGDIDKGDVAV